MKRNRMKFYFVVLLFTLFVRQHASAQTLVLHHRDGTITDIQLYTEPSVKFSEEKIIVTSPVLNMEYPVHDILRFTYKDRDTGILSPKIDQCFTREQDRLVFHNVKSMSDINIFTPRGVRQQVDFTQLGTDIMLFLSDIPSGIYLISVNGKSFKITKHEE